MLRGEASAAVVRIRPEVRRGVASIGSEAAAGCLAYSVARLTDGSDARGESRRSGCRDRSGDIACRMAAGACASALAGESIRLAGTATGLHRETTRLLAGVSRRSVAREATRLLAGTPRRAVARESTRILGGHAADGRATTGGAVRLLAGHRLGGGSDGGLSGRGDTSRRLTRRG